MAEQGPIGIVVPVDGEFEPYRALLPGMRRRDDCGPWDLFETAAQGRTLLLIISGAGPVNAAAATERLIARYEPRALLNGGSAGAHRPDLLPGDVVIGERYVIHTPRGVRAARVARGLNPSLIRYRRDSSYTSFPHLDAEPALVERAERVAVAVSDRLGPWDAPGWPVGEPSRPARVMRGIVASADAWTVEVEELLALHEDFGAACEDMESAYVAQVCAMHRLPFVAVRCMSDNEGAQQLTPADVPAAIAAAGERAAAIIVALAREV